MLSIGSLFSGIGGLELGLEWAGLGPTLWQCESDPFCREVLRRHWPQAEIHDDVRTLDLAALAPVDLLCGGFPCQDLSSAGKGAGLGGDRSGLWYGFLHVAQGLRPRWIVVENVASGARRWVDAVRGDLEREGYATLPVTLSAALVGAPHRRERVFVLGHLADAGTGGLRSWGHDLCPGQPDSARSSGSVAYAHRDKQPQHEGALGEERGRAGDGRQPQSAAHPNGLRRDGRPRLPEAARPGGLHAPQRGDLWAAEPDVGRVAYGVPRRVDRLRALGNAVVPQCAEVVGWVIRELDARYGRG